MTEGSYKSEPSEDLGKPRPFRRAVLRGLGLVLPPLLTIVLFIWAWTTIERYVLQPIEAGAHNVIVWNIADVRDENPEPGTDRYRRLASGRWIPTEVYDCVERADEQVPRTSEEVYDRYVELTYLRRIYVIPLFLAFFILFLYLFGRFLAAGAGRMMWNLFENVIHRLPVIRNVYSSVKQVTDFVFSEREIEFNRVVAVEYPRKGIWSLGFVTGESMLDIRSAANEPVLSVLMPTSPMPATGFTITVPKGETVDVDITVDQAIQFIVSCGVVVPPQQLQKAREIGARISEAIARRAGTQRVSEPPRAVPALPAAPAGSEQANGQAAPSGRDRRAPKVEESGEAAAGPHAETGP